jgi:CTP:molybdopterin cytidylyltransferase MocA
MSESVVCGVRELTSTAKAILITPVDHPAVSPTVVAHIIDSWRKGARMVVPTWQGRGGHPVLIDASLRDELLKLGPERGLRGLFESHLNSILRLEVDSPYIARDMDTWDDYVLLHKDVFGVSPRHPDYAEPEQSLAPETN